MHTVRSAQRHAASATAVLVLLMLLAEMVGASKQVDTLPLFVALRLLSQHAHINDAH